MYLIKQQQNEKKKKKNPFILKNKNIIYIFAQSCCNLLT